MARKIPAKGDVRQLKDLALKLRDTEHALLPALKAYASALDDMASMADQISNAMQDYIDERSDRWQDSDAGHDYTNLWDAVTRAASWRVEDTLPDLLQNASHAQKVLDLDFGA